ncbi:MAG: cobalamin-binding protein [Wenzhouxiangellaceae bacterium]
MRIVSHTCSNTEIVCALGLAHYLVGVDDHSDYPAEVVRELPRIGPDLDIDIDKVRALQPDLVLTSLTVPGHERCVARLREADLPLLVAAPLSLSDVAADIERIAAALGARQRGQELAEHFRSAMSDAADQQPPVPIAVEWWPKPVIVPAAESWVTQMLPLAGAVNPWREHEGASVTVNDDAIQAMAPQAVVMSWCGVAVDKYRPHIVSRRPAWQSIPAVRNGHIYPISEALLGRPGPRLIEGLQALRQIVERVREAGPAIDHPV